MKRVIIIFMIIIFESGCKKCLTCSNECWQCKNLASGSFCSTDYYSQAQYNSVLDVATAHDSCWKINSTKSVEICQDKTAQAVLEQKNFFCK